MENTANLSLFSEFEVVPEVKFCIVIPVKDEEDYILNTLSAFTTQRNLHNNLLNVNIFEILILANNCSDASVELIKEFQDKNPEIHILLEEISLPEHLANIGFVRKNLMQTAYERLLKNGGGVILTTDGDTTVSEDWIAQNNFEIENGADAVGGRILLYPDEVADLDESTYSHHIKDEQYQLLMAKLESIILESETDPYPRHHQHFNGSFAITTECFKKSGGVPDVTHLEDMAFFERLNLIDAKVRHSNNVLVHTSARCIGRTEIGLSYQLNEWKNRRGNPDEFFVESAKTTIDRLILKKKLMDVWKIKTISEQDFIFQIRSIFPQIPVDENLYFDYFLLNNYFGEWFATMDQYINESALKFPPDHIENVITELENACRDYAVSNFSQTSIR